MNLKSMTFLLSAPALNLLSPSAFGGNDDAPIAVADPIHRHYTQTFVDHVQVLGSIARPTEADHSHQAVTTAAGVVLP